MSSIEIFLLYFVFTGLVTYALERYDLKQIRAGKHKEEMQAIEEVMPDWQEYIWLVDVLALAFGWLMLPLVLVDAVAEKLFGKTFFKITK